LEKKACNLVICRLSIGFYTIFSGGNGNPLEHLEGILAVAKDFINKKNVE
jgi:hypothetical protein